MKHIPTLFIAVLSVLAMVSCKSQKSSEQSSDTDTIAVTQVQFNADSAYASIEKQCSFGARVPNSEAHRLCGDYIVKSFKALGLEVTEQKTDQTAWDGKTLHTRNIIASYRPEATDRIIICTHWESRPWADADPDSTKHHQPVMAANDGASGVAVMLEVARHLSELKPNVGIDFICFDSEDYGTPYWASDKDPKDTGLHIPIRRATKLALAYCSTWWVDRMLATLMRASACAMLAMSWCAYGTLPHVPMLAISSSP